MKFAVTFSLCLLATIATGQSPDRSLHSYIQRYQEETESSFSYDTELLSIIGLTDEQWASEAVGFLSSLNSTFPLNIDTVSEQYFVVRLAETKYSIAAQDSTTEKVIPGEYLSLLKNGQPMTGKRQNQSLSLTFKPSRADTVHLYAIGYEPKIIPWHELIQSTEITGILAPAFVQLADVTIEDYLTSGIDLNPASQSISIDVTALPLLPGETDGDLFASLAALPGITTPDNRPGNLFIRGSSTDQSYIMIDNIPIYSRGHYFGTISPYNPKVVDKVEVHRNGFHPRLGGRVGGAIEIKTDEATESRTSGGIGVNTLFAMGYFKTPLANKKIGLSIGARRSFPSSFLSPKLDAITKMVYAGSAVTGNTSGDVMTDVNVTFEDYQLSGAFNPNKKNHFTISGLYTRSNIGFMVEMPRRTPFPSETNNSNIGVSSSWNNQVNDQLSSSLNASFSTYELDFLSNEAVDNPPTPDLNGGYSINTIEDFSINEELNWQLKRGVSIDLGAEYRRQKVHYNYKGTESPNEPSFIDSKDKVANTISPYVNLEFNQWKKWFLQIGNRINYYDLTGDIDFAPRVFSSWYLSNYTTLKSSFGLYYQYLSQVKLLEFSSGGFDNELWLLADGSTAQPISGTQSMIGGVWNKNNWVVDIEVYHKTAQNVNYFSNKRFTSNGTFNPLDHESYGADLLVRKKINDHLESWLGYSCSQLIVTTDSVEYESRYSQPHMINTGISYHRNNLKISAGWRLASGLNGASIELAQIIDTHNSSPSPPNRPKPENPFYSINERYPVVHFFDISASYTLPKTADRNWAATFGLSLINVYNQENLTDYVVRNAENPDGRPMPLLIERNAISFAPNLMITIEW